MTRSAPDTEPDDLRTRLLAETARLIAEQGLQAVTIRAVCAAVGVTKGGLFHHFPSKDALIAAVFADQLSSFDAQIEAAMDADPVPHGRFTRAYIRTVLGEMQAPFIHLSIATMTDAGLRRLWFDWVEDRRTRHKETDSDPSLAVLRYAADGAWNAGLWPDEHQIDFSRTQICDQLCRQTTKDLPQ